MSTRAHFDIGIRARARPSEFQNSLSKGMNRCLFTSYFKVLNFVTWCMMIELHCADTLSLLRVRYIVNAVHMCIL